MSAPFLPNKTPRPFAPSKAPKKKQRLYTIHALDIETDAFKHKENDNPQLRYVTYANEAGERASSTDMVKMLRHLLSKNLTKNDRIYIHNLSFDFRYIIDAYFEGFCDAYYLRLYARGAGQFWRVDFIARAELGKTRPQPSLSFYDSMAVYGRSLAEFTKRFAPDCQKIKRAKSFDEAPFDPTSKDDRDYAMQDVVSLCAAIAAFDDAIFSAFGAHLKGTISSTALEACKRRLPEGTEIWRQNQSVEARERLCYGGGAVLMNFRPYEVMPSVVSFDVNSEYPACMKGEFPASNCTATLVSEYVPGKLGFYHVRVSMPDFALIGLQRKDERGQLAYCSGEYDTYCTGEEIAYYQTHGATFQVLDGHIYEESAAHFEPFVTHCETIRKRYTQECRPDMVEVTKLMQNSVYGKFGTKPDDRTEYVCDGTADHIDLGYDPHFDEQTGEFCGIYKRKANIDEPYMLPAIAALVTARGRLLLQRGIDVCGRDQVYYCDTDSIKCSPLGAERMRQSVLFDNGTGDYGKFKDEGTLSGMVFVAPKVYGTIDGKLLKAKGLQSAIKKHRKECPNLSIIDVADSGQLDYYSVTGLESYLKKHGAKGTVRKRALTKPEHCASHELRGDNHYHPRHVIM